MAKFWHSTKCVGLMVAMDSAQCDAAAADLKIAAGKFPARQNCCPVIRARMSRDASFENSEM